MEGNTCPYCDTQIEPSEKKKEDSREYKPFNYADSAYQYTVEKWYAKTWVIVLFLIFFFPVGLFLMWRYKEWRKVTKIVITVIIAPMAIWGLFSPDTPKEDATLASPVQTAAVSGSRNVSLPEGTTLTVSSTSIQLVPVR